MVISNDVNNAVKDYINSNLLSRYQFDHIDLYISYNDLSVSGLRFRNIWDQKIVSDLNLVKSYTKIDTDPNTLEIIFTQTNSSQSTILIIIIICILLNFNFKQMKTYCFIQVLFFCG